MSVAILKRNIYVVTHQWTISSLENWIMCSKYSVYWVAFANLHLIYNSEQVNKIAIYFISLSSV